MAKPKPEKKPAAAVLATSRVLPMELQVGDRLVGESGECEVIGQPYTSAGGKLTRVRVRRVDQPDVTDLRVWSSHERLAVRRA